MAKMIVLNRLHCKDMIPPRRQVEIKPPVGKVISAPIVYRLTQPVGKPPGAPGEVIPRQGEVTLTWMVGVVHHHQAAEIVFAIPGEGNKGRMAAIACPARVGIEELPLPFTEYRILQAGEKPVIE